MIELEDINLLELKRLGLRGDKFVLRSNMDAAAALSRFINVLCQLNQMRDPIRLSPAHKKKYVVGYREYSVKYEDKLLTHQVALRLIGKIRTQPKSTLKFLITLKYYYFKDADNRRVNLMYDRYELLTDVKDSDLLVIVKLKSGLRRTTPEVLMSIIANLMRGNVKVIHLGVSPSVKR